MGRQTGTVKYPHHEAAFFWAEVSNGFSAMEYSEVSQASTMTALILSKNPRRNLPADQAAMGFAQVLEGAVKRTTGKKKLQEISPSMGTFTCQCTLFVGVRYPIFPPLLWRKR